MPHQWKEKSITYVWTSKCWRDCVEIIQITVKTVWITTFSSHLSNNTTDACMKPKMWMKWIDLIAKLCSDFSIIRVTAEIHQVSNNQLYWTVKQINQLSCSSLRFGISIVWFEFFFILSPFEFSAQKLLYAVYSLFYWTSKHYELYMQFESSCLLFYLSLIFRLAFTPQTFKCVVRRSVSVSSFW